MKNIFLASLLILLLSACEFSGSLRGSIEESKDGKTYLAIIDDNGGGCGPMLLDGKPWPYEIGEVAEVSPGNHEIHCGNTIGFIIPEGTIFKFDYWGP